MKSRYKLLVVGPQNRHIETFVSRLASETGQIDVITNGPVSLPGNIRIFLTDFSLRKITNLITTTRFILKIIKQVDPDIIHVHQINSVALYAILANFFARKPIVLTAWGSDILVAPEKSFILKSIVRFCLKHADGFTSDSAFMAEKMKALAGDSTIDVRIINFGVIPVERTIKKEKIIYSNRLHKTLYRVDFIIRAFANFIKTEKGKDWRLIVAASGTETDNLKKLVEELGLGTKIEFAGFLDNKQNADNYARSSVFVSIPESDATSVSLLEAMYYECVPVVSDLPANREWISDRVNGFIVQDVSTAFFNETGGLDFEVAGKRNKSIILETATAEVASRNFSTLHLNLISKK